MDDDLLSRRGRIPVQQIQRRHHLTRLAEAALGHLFVDPGPLDGVDVALRAFGGEPFDGGDVPALQAPGLDLAGEGARPVQVDGTGPAHGHAATELGAGKTQVIPDNPEQRRVGFHVYRGSLSVDRKIDVHQAPSLGWVRTQSAPEKRLALRTLIHQVKTCSLCMNRCGQDCGRTWTGAVRAAATNGSERSGLRMYRDRSGRDCGRTWIG